MSQRPPDPVTAPVKPPTGGDVHAYRAYYRRHVRPRAYSRTGHLLVHLGPVLATCGWSLSRLRDVRPGEWLVLPVGTVLASWFVYWFHRSVLHRPRAFAPFLYVKHTKQHHRFYTYDHITPDEPADLHITLFPWWSGSLVVAAMGALAYGLAPLIGHNSAWLVLLFSCGYLLAYEVIHTISHLPEGHLLTRLPVLSLLREHHRLHHDPALMGRHNFNIVLPLFDWLYGALVRSRPRP